MRPLYPPNGLHRALTSLTCLVVAAASLAGCEGSTPAEPAKSVDVPGKRAGTVRSTGLGARTLDTLEAQVRALNRRLGSLPRLLSVPSERELGIAAAESFRGWLPGGAEEEVTSPLNFGRFASEVSDRWDVHSKDGTACKVKVWDVEVRRGPSETWVGDVTINCRSNRPAAPPCASTTRSKITVEVLDEVWSITQIAMVTADRKCPQETRFVDKTEAVGMRYSGLPFAKQGRDAMNWQGVASGDVNGDGLWDVFIPGRIRNHLYLNTPSGGFVEVADAWGVADAPGGTGVVFFDYDNDGDQDLFVGHPGTTPETAGPGVRAFENMRNKVFVERTAELGFTAQHAAYPLVAFDANLDGFVDLYVGSYGHLLSESNNSWVNATNGRPDALYLNERGTAFRLASKDHAVGGTAFTYAAAAADVDRDGHLDLYLGNDFAPNSLLLGSTSGRFVERAVSWGAEAPGNAMGVTFADLDSNGELDVVVTHMASSAGDRILRHVAPELRPEEHGAIAPFAAGNAILLRRGKSFTPLPADAVGVASGWAWGPALADFDLDGDLDMYVTNGYVSGESEHDT